MKYHQHRKAAIGVASAIKMAMAYNNVSVKAKIIWQPAERQIINT
jgi:hypothetical protein